MEQEKSAQELAAELEAMFADAPTVEESNAILAANAVDYETDPEFVADYMKGRFVEDVLQAMELKGVNKNQLAKKLGKSRQHVTQVLTERTNFTLETLARFACALDMRVGVRLYTPEERLAIVSAVREPKLHLLQGYKRETEAVKEGARPADGGHIAA